MTGDFFFNIQSFFHSIYFLLTVIICAQLGFKKDAVLDQYQKMC